MKKRGRNIFWGILLILAAAFWLTSEMGYFPNIGFAKIFFSGLWGAFVLKGFIDRESFCVFMGLAFLGIVWDKELGIEAITPWPVIGAAILLTIGCSLIFKGIGRKKWEKNFSYKFTNDGKHWHKRKGVDVDYNKTGEGNIKYGTDQPNQSHADGEHVYHMNRFSGAEKYIDSQNLKSVEIINKAGGIEVYLDHAKAAGDKVYMRIECYAGGMEIYIPRSWRVENNVNCFAGAVDGPEAVDEAINDVTLVLSGTVKAAGVEIIRV